VTDHTPGPWTVTNALQTSGTRAPIVGYAGGWVARVFHPSAMPGLTSLAPPADEAEANARLIAAAPDLLAALKAIQAACMDDSSLRHTLGTDLLDAVDAALARAEMAVSS